MRPTERQQIGRYRLEELIGAGAMGRVYRAYDPELHRDVAIKLGWTCVDPRIASAERKRIVREARAVAGLRHPHIVSVFDVGTVEDGVYIVMELVEGGTAQALAVARKKWQEVLRTYVPVAEALAAVHAAEMVHRDVKPSNILLGRDGRVRLGDFGLVQDDASGTAASDVHARAEHRTAIAGTPAYMAPEQKEGRAATHLSDQYAWCASVYEALYGELPKRAHAQIECPADPHVPPWLTEVLVRGLSHAPPARWPAMNALLQAVGQQRRISRSLAVAVTVVCSVPLLGTSRPPSCADLIGGLEDVWNASSQKDIRAAFSADIMASAPRIADRIIPRLDAYVAQWNAASQRACSSEEVGERAHQFGCLRRARESLRVRIEPLKSPRGPHDIEQALLTTASLTPLSRCLDAAPSASTATSGRAFENLWVLLESSELAHEQGDYAKAYELARTAEKRARDLGADALQVEAMLAAAGNAYVSLRLEDARSLADATFDAALALHADDLAMRAAGIKVEIEAQRAHQSSAEDSLRWTESLFRRMGSRASDVPTLASAQAAIANLRGGAEAATTAVLSRLSARMAEFEADDPRLVLEMGAAVETLRHHGRLELAHEYAARSVELVRHHWGDDGPNMADALLRLGGVLLAQQRLAEAIAALQRAAKIVETLELAGALRWADLYDRLGSAFHLHQRTEEAIAAYQWSLAITEAELDVSPQRASTLTNLGNALRYVGRFDEARDVLVEGLNVHERLSQAPDDAALNTLALLANLALDVGNTEEAKRWVGQARDLVERARDISVAKRLSYYDTEHQLARAIGHDTEALAWGHKILETATQELGPEHPHVAYAHSTMAALFAEGGRWREAVRHYVEFSRIADHGGVDGRWHGEELVAQAAIEARWDRASARVHLERALTFVEGDFETLQPWVDAIPAKTGTRAWARRWLTKTRASRS